MKILQSLATKRKYLNIKEKRILIVFSIRPLSQIMARLLVVLLLLCSWTTRAAANTSEDGQTKNKCTKQVTQVSETPNCILCPLNAFIGRCPTGSTKLTVGMGLRKCILGFKLYGCVHLCRRTIRQPICCQDYWGRDCQPCPGLESGQKACFGNGRCNDRDAGNGTCQCAAGFEGFACELCTNKTRFGIKCQTDCTCQNGECNSGALADGRCANFSCRIGYHGDNCEIYEKGCDKNCHNHSHCYVNRNKSDCKCNPGYTGDGINCAEIDPCKSSNSLCPKNTVCQKTGPGRHKCVCRPGFTGDGVVCAAIDPCQTSNGNCTNNTRCNYLGPGKANCSCLAGYDNYDPVKGCSIVNLCIPDQDCLELNAECVMLAPGKKECRCKSGYVGNGTVCNGNIIQRIDDFHSSGKYKGKFRHVKNIIKHHSDLTFAFTHRGPFTVFLPTDDGLEAKLTTEQLRSIISDKTMVQDLILVHTASAYLPMSSLNVNGNLTTLKGWDAVVTENNGSFFYLAGRTEKPSITEPDVIAWNGIIHVIDKPVWIPDFTNVTNTSSETLWHIIAKRSELSVFKEFIQIADMESEFRTTSTSDRTVIAPVNESFAKLGTNKTEFLKSARGKAKLQAIIRHHIFALEIGVIDLRYKDSLMSFAPELVRVNVTSKGALILGGESKLIENNIPTANGYLHLTDTVLVPSFVLPIVQKYCENNITKVYSPCRPCHLSYNNGNCPRWTVKSGKKESCLYRINYLIGSRIARGCRSICVPAVRKCCPGFYGKSCSPCPGPVGDACFGNGKCSEGASGNGACRCNPGFTGTACELCKDSKMFGSNCDKTCSCVQGVCDNGRSGSGTCLPHSCVFGYSGKNCAFKLRRCFANWKLYTEYCHIHSTAFCNNTNSKKPTCVCNAGYRQLGKDCYEINPCLEDDRGGCDKNAVCMKTRPGKNNCTCSVGWTGDGTYCTPINYCDMPSGARCHANAKCTSLGMMKCECYPGYEGDGFSCREINSCLKNNGNCPLNARCIKKGPGINNCKCRVGYLRVGFERCLPSLSLVIQGHSKLTKISKLMVKYNLVRFLAAPRNMTTFVPSDDAISSLDANSTNLLHVPNNLFYLGGSNTALGLHSLSELRNKATETIPSLFKNVNITIDHTSSGEPLIGSLAKIIIANITASNGLLHIVDRVLFPPFVKKPRVEPNVFQGLCNNSKFTEMCTLIKKFKLEEKIKSCDHCTVFVPTNDAFHRLSQVKHNNISSTDILYHITNHTLWEASIVHGQQFTSLAGNFYRLSLERKDGEKQITVNGVNVKFYNSSSKWVIYTIPKVLQAVKNTCFKTLKVISKTRCRPCRRFASTRCANGSRYAGKEDCIYSAFGSYFLGCRTVCETPVKVRECCPGFFGKHCFACPGGNDNPCFGNGVCDGSRNGTGQCSCKEGFLGIACEICSPGHHGPNCKVCGCYGDNVTCDKKSGECFCPPDRKGLLCEKPATYEKCVNGSDNTTAACDKNAICDQNRTENARCKCDYAFTGNGTQCKRVNLCKPPDCSPNAECHYNSALHNRTCTCKPKYEGDGYVCQALNPCLKENGYCHKQLADCVYLGPNRSVCKCKAGFTGDGRKSCEPIPLCGQDNGGCSFFATCSFNEKSLETTCACNDGYIGDGKKCVGDIWESLQIHTDLAEFRSRLVKSSIKDILSPENHFTVIAPNNNAFTSSRRKRRSVDTLSESDLRHYIISCVALSEDDVGKGKQSFVSVAGSWLNVTSSNVINGNVHVKSVSITANSTIVVVDSLLDIPDDQRNSLDNMTLTNVAKRKGYRKFVQLLTYAEMLDIESDIYHQPHTVFWPTDEAFSRLPNDIQERLFDSRKNTDKDYIRDIMNYHIIQKIKVFTKDILVYSGGLFRRTREGSPLYMSCKGHKGDLYINGRSKIVERDIGYQGGIAFGISEVLLPPGVAGRCDDIKYERVQGSCTACGDNGFCPPGTILESVDKNASCVYQGKYIGCLSRCMKRTKVAKCCKNFYGPNCQACPGGLKPCGGRGRCDDGLHSSGNCNCSKPFIGPNCDICPSPDVKCSNITSKICTSRDNPCSIFATCVATREKLCVCYKGYEGDGYYCQAIDKCQKNNGGCSKYAICRYTGPNSASCECRSGYVGDGRTCTALSPSSPCARNNGNCHTHALCADQDGAVFCSCRKGFYGDGIFCAGSAKDLIYTIEELSEFAKSLKQLSMGFEGHALLRHLSSEKDYTVFAPINYAFTSTRMNINEVKNHIVAGYIPLRPATTETLANTNITIAVLKNKKIRINKMANVLQTYPARNGMVVVIDHTLPYVKPPHQPKTTTAKPERKTETRPTQSTTDKGGSVKASHGKGLSPGAISGTIVAVVVVVVIIFIAIFFARKRRNSAGIKYNRNFENVPLESEPYNEEDEQDENDDEYEHQTLQHPSSEIKGTTLQNPTYVGNEADIQNDVLEMTETSSIVPLTDHDATSFSNVKS